MIGRILNLTPETRREWRQGWPAIGASLIGGATTQIHFASLGVLIKPITQSTGWPATTVTAGIFICSVIAVPGTPLAGWLGHRYGLGRVMMLGLPFFLLAFAALGLFSHSQTEWIAGWMLLGCIGILTKANLWVLWTAQKFEAARGLAFATITSGAGLMAIFIPILTQMCVEAAGWRGTFPILAAVGSITILTSYLGFKACPPTPGDRTRRLHDIVAPASGMTIQEAIRYRAFWQIALIAFLIGCGLISLQIHMVPMFRAKGLDARTAALIAGLFGGAALVGRFIAGACLDRYSAKVIGMVSLLLPAAACLMFSFLPVGPVSGAFIALLFGAGAGAESDVLGYITGKYFGIRSFGVIFGVVSAMFGLGSGIGPMVASFLLDKFGSYAAVTPIIFVMLLVCAVLFPLLGAYPASPDEEHDLPDRSGGKATDNDQPVELLV